MAADDVAADPAPAQIGASSGAAPLVAHVIHQLRVGGLENGLVNIINTMPAGAYRHAVLCVEDFSDFRQRITRPDVQVIALDRSRVGAWGVRRALYDYFRRARPAIVHSRNTSGLDALMPAALAGVRCRVHGEHGWDVDNLHGQRFKPRLLRRLHSPLVGHYVTVSLDLKRYLVEAIGVSERRITDICNGVDTERFKPSAQPDLAWLPVSFHSPDVVRVGTVGRLQPVKDQATLLRGFVAARAMSPRGGDLRLVIVGGGPLEAELKALAQSLGVAEVCHFAGDRSDVARVLEGLHLFVLPSLNEGISNTILEAMACAVPAIVTAVGGNVELVPNGEVGMHIRPRDEDALARILCNYVADPALRLTHARAARQRAVQRYSLSTMVSAYQGLYDRLLGRAGAAVPSARGAAGNR